MKPLTVTIIILSVALGLFSGYLIFKPKVASVNVVQIYNQFSMKKEMEKKFQNDDAKRKKLLDSLKLSYQNKFFEMTSGATKQQKTELGNKMEEEFLIKEQQLKQQSLQESEEYKEKIWKRLQLYIKEYSKDKGFQYILGLEENSFSVIYSDESMDITKELEEYVNDRYHGGK